MATPEGFQSYAESAARQAFALIESGKRWPILQPVYNDDALDYLLAAYNAEAKRRFGDDVYVVTGSWGGSFTCSWVEMHLRYRQRRPF